MIDYQNTVVYWYFHFFCWLLPTSTVDFFEMRFYWHFSVNAAVNRDGPFMLLKIYPLFPLSQLVPILMCKRSALFIPVEVHCGSSTCLWSTPTGFTLHYAVWLLYGSSVLWESLITCKLSIRVEDECFNHWGGWETHACHVQVWSGCTCLMFCTVSRAVPAPGLKCEQVK